MSSTTKGAGHTLRIDWATVRQHEMRMEEFIKHLRRLMDNGLVGKTDEVASARRRFKNLIGPSGIYLMLKEFSHGRKKCWRDPLSEQKQATIILEEVTRRLRDLRKECWNARGGGKVQAEPH